MSIARLNACAQADCLLTVIHGVAVSIAGLNACAQADCLLTVTADYSTQLRMAEVSCILHAVTTALLFHAMVQTAVRCNPNSQQAADGSRRTGGTVSARPQQPCDCMKEKNWQGGLRT